MTLSIFGWKPFSKKKKANAQVQPTVIPLPPSSPQEPVEQAPTHSPIQAAVSPPTTVVHPKDQDPPAISSLPENVTIPTTAQPVQSMHPPPQIDDPQRSAGPLEAVDPEEIERIREKCTQFRVLIIGKANSGKTTIIRKMCDSDEDPTVYDENGEELAASVLENPTAMRGIHDIHHQIIHKNNPNFIFHDSRGFEAGSIAEFELVKAFIKEMLAKTKLKGRLHAIWLLVPVDSTRVASKAELSFFEENLGDVPVIVVFTKWDGQVIRAFNKLQYEKNMGIAQAKREASQLARTILEEEFVPIFKNTRYPPASYAVLGYMNKPGTKCGELVEKTAAALNDNVLKKLFVSVQTHNLELCIKSGIEEAVSGYIFSSSSNSNPDREMVIRVVLSWFPHIYWYHDYSEELRYGRELRLLGYEREAIESFQPVISSSKQAFLSPRLQHLHNAASAAIVATRSFDVEKRTGDTVGAFKTSIEEYLASPQYHVVKEAVNSKFLQYSVSTSLRDEDATEDTDEDTDEDADEDMHEYTHETVTKIVEELQKICLDNLLTFDKSNERTSSVV